MKAFHLTLSRVATACLVLWFARLAPGEVPEQRLRFFGFAGASGSNPVGLMVGTDGALYGTTVQGGIGAAGTVFRVNPDGTGYAVLHAFLTNGGDGQSPLAGLIQGRGGMWYGTTSAGGNNQAGTVFKLAPDGTAYSVLHHFGGTVQDGATPKAALVSGTDGTLYGTTFNGGTNGFGTVFKLGADGAGYEQLYSFVGGDQGVSPQAALVLGADGLLYGASYGGQTVFKLGTDGTGFALVHRFGVGDDGWGPLGLAPGRDGAWYGTTERGGTNDAGTVFRVGTDGSAYAVLHHFSGTLGDGANPGAPLMRGVDGAWYGTTASGGSRRKEGTVFRLEGDGTGYRVIRRFTVITSVLSDYSTDAQQPGPLAQAADGRLYGASYYGGTTSQGQHGQGAGTIFFLSPTDGQYAVIHDFSNSGGDGASPQAGLLLGRDGALYGATQAGGGGGAGTVFKLNAAGGGYEVIHSFGLNSLDGLAPQAALIQGRDGMLYGTASSGGYGGSGVAFKMNPDGGHYTVLHSFGSVQNDDGWSPATPLLQGRDGQLYGTTAEGGYSSIYSGYGTVFKLNTNGTVYSLLHLFSTNGVEGQNPQGGLIQGTDGALYGTTHGGPSLSGFGLSYGNVFKLLTDGNGYQVLHTFTNNGIDGTHPTAALVRGADGALYGTTKYGGTNPGPDRTGGGTVFKLNPDGSGYQVLYHFGNTTRDGQNPAAPLVLGSDGALYGTTTAGGAYVNVYGGGYGIAFKLNPDGTGYTVLHSFDGNSGDGWVPQGGLTQGLDGAFYGTTVYGGDLAGGNGATGYGADVAGGMVFRLGPSPLLITAYHRLPDKTLLLSLSGAPNTTCRIDACANLGSWVTLTNLPNTTGTVHFLDTSAPRYPRRFYRAVQTP